MPDEVVENIRQNVNIVDVISPYVTLKKQGRNFFGKCPWHEERTPSFSVNEEKQIFHCFSCGRGGNVYTFLMEKEDLTFVQAVARVAEQAGVELDASYIANNQANQSRISDQERAVLALYDDAMHFYHYLLLNTAVGSAALNYLHQRGLDDSTIDTYMLGYAPEGDALFQYFKEKNIDYQLLRDSELFIEWDDGSLHDRFVDRALFTIRNQNGAPIAFSGRRMSQDDSVAKYMNSPESLIFDKSNELFNLDLAKGSIRKTKSVILFEGFMDVIAAFQAGVTNGVASMGTSLTQKQVQRLGRMAQVITIAYDADTAGQAASLRALNLIEQNSAAKPQILHIPDGLDPDEYVRQKGVEAFRQVLQRNLEDPVAFSLRYFRQDYNLQNQNDIFNYLEQVLPVVAGVKEPLVRQTYLKRLADEFDVSLDGLEEQLRHLLLQKTAQGRASDNKMQASQANLVEHVAQRKPQLSGIEQAERILLAWMLKDQDVWLMVTREPNFQFVDVIYETIFLLAENYKEINQVTTIDNLANFMNFVKEPEMSRMVAELDNINPALMQNKSQVPEYIQVIVTTAPLQQQIVQKKRALSEAKQMHNDSLVTQLSMELLTLLRKQQTKDLASQ
ncbi:DNA primase [Weissella kandleri]|uniref:DNA primase n=1 Tax=Weissella kandleri TaxID=1616 RepID=UPI00387E341E